MAGLHCFLVSGGCIPLRPLATNTKRCVFDAHYATVFPLVVLFHVSELCFMTATTVATNDPLPRWSICCHFAIVRVLSLLQAKLQLSATCPFSATCPMTKTQSQIPPSPYRNKQNKRVMNCSPQTADRQSHRYAFGAIQLKAVQAV